MAGTLILLAKNDLGKEKYLSQTRLLETFINKVFREYFSTITFRNIDNKTFLVEFRQYDHKKYHMDNDGNWLTFEGNVFALDETCAYDAKDLWNLYQNFGQDFAAKLDGHFVIKLFDKEKDTWLIINDFIKYKTNFLTENENSIMFTPFILTTGILKEPQLDLYAFNEFMWRYYVLSERSILKDVKRLSPASIYKVQNGKISRRTYWESPHHFTDLSFNEVVEKSAGSIKESARLICKSFKKPGIDFTLGQDTRYVISGFTSQKLDFATATYGKDDFNEVQGVKEIARRLHVKNHHIRLTEEFLGHVWYHFQRSLILGNCEEPGYLLGRILFMREQYKNFADVVVNGAEGRFYKNGLWDEMYTFNFYREPEKFDRQVFLKYRALSKNYFDKIFTPAFLEIKQNSKAYFSELIDQSIKDYLDSPVSVQVDHFDLSHWLNFGIAANSGVNTLIPAISTLLLRRNLDFALTIPVKWKFNRSKLQRAVVHKLDPALAREKTDFGGINMVPKNFFTVIPFYVKYFYAQSSRLRNKIKSILGLKVITHLQEAWDYLPVYQKLFAEAILQENLDYDKMILSGIMEKDKWDNFINHFDARSARLEEFEYVFKLVSVEAFLKMAKQMK